MVSSHMLFFLASALASWMKPTVAMEPLALLATQPAWQAGQPVTVNVDYDGENMSMTVSSEPLATAQQFFFLQCLLSEP